MFFDIILQSTLISMFLITLGFSQSLIFSLKLGKIVDKKWKLYEIALQILFQSVSKFLLINTIMGTHVLYVSRCHSLHFIHWIIQGEIVRKVIPLKFEIQVRVYYFWWYKFRMKMGVLQRLETRNKVVDFQGTVVSLRIWKHTVSMATATHRPGNRLNLTFPLPSTWRRREVESSGEAAQPSYNRAKRRTMPCKNIVTTYIRPVFIIH